MTNGPFESLFAEPLRNGLTRPRGARGRGVRMVNMGEVFAYPHLSDQEMELVELSDREREDYLLRPGDLLFARQSLVWDGAGQCCLVRDFAGEMTFESHLIRARLDDTAANSAFFYYFFRSPEGRGYMETIMEQMAAAGIRSSDLARLEIPVPAKWRQDRAAEVLLLIDDRIEVNRRINRNLDALALSLFRSWFVDFDPVTARAEGRMPFGMSNEVAALFPYGFADGIPDGWSSSSLGDLAVNPKRQVKPGDVAADSPYFGLEHLPRRQIALDDWGRADKVSSAKYRFDEGAILFGKLRPYFHKVGVAPVAGICSTDILVVAPKDPAHFAFVLGHCSSVEFIDYVDAASGGTKMPRTDWYTMSCYAVARPPDPVLLAFGVLVHPMLERLRLNTLHNLALKTLRDALLGPLVSGELRLKPAEREVEAALA